MENKYKNNEERFFSYYLDELKEAGLITSYTYEEDTFELGKDVKYEWIKKTQLKTKLKKEIKESSLLKPVTYTPDFVIKGFKREGMPFSSQFLMEGMPTFLLSIYNKELNCYVDVKGAFAGRTNSTQYTFPIKQKWMWEKYRIYTNKIVPEKLFKATFTPKQVIEESVFKRDISKRGIKAGDSKLKYKPITIEEWLKQK